jgi:hypothetical protein
MSNLKLAAAAAAVILPSIMFALSAMAQEAVQEPGEQAFYESLRGGSAARTNARASIDNTGTIPTASAKHRRSASRVAHKQ